ncbi:MAG: DUF2589 domain-containing protein [Clostridiales bacterium]|nr:DUF2589 domain-containing protein [Clostridiales bacterium]
MAVTDQFAGLDMKNLIGGPLSAAADASLQMAQSTADFISKVGFDSNGKLRVANFGYERRTTNDDGTTNLDQMRVAVPMLAIVPIPNLQVDEVNILFDMEVKQCEKTDKSMDAGSTQSGGLGLGVFKVNITGSVSAHDSNTRQSDNSAKYHVDVRATNHGMPEGLSRVLDMMAANVSPSLVGSELRDGNGQTLQDKAKEKAERLKTLRGDIAVLESSQSAAQKAVDGLLATMRDLGTTQLEEFRTAYNSLTEKQQAIVANAEAEKKKADKDKKAELDKDEKAANDTMEQYDTAFNKVSISWQNFKDQLATTIELVAGKESADGDKISDIFALKEFKSDGTQDKYASDDSNSNYAALVAAQNKAITAQLNLDNITSQLADKNLEYNNAISGASTSTTNAGSGSEDNSEDNNGTT